jgi:hemolysin activation/secretion protein
LISHTHRGLGYVAAAIASLVATTAAYAQATAPTNAGRALESTAKPTTEPKKDADVLPRNDAARQPAAEAGPTVSVKGFRITGNTVFADEVLQPLVAPWVGKQVGTEQLLDAAEAIKNRYKDAGYFLTQVFVPAQEVPDGVITLRVVEAHVGKTRADVDSQRVGAGLVDGYMNLLPDGAPVTEQNVERPLLLLNDLPGVKVNSVLRPGAEFGQADLLVKVVDEGSTFGGDAYVDNAGSKSTGQARVGVDIVANGLAGFGESWQLGGLVSEHDGIDLVRAGVTVPVGPYGTKATASLTDLHYKVTGAAFEQLHADGYAYVGSLLVQHPLIRSRNGNLFLVGGVDLKVVNDRQQDGQFQDDRHLAIGNFGVTGDFRDQYFGGSLNTYTATLFAGDNRIEDADQRARDLATGHKTSGEFQHINGDFQRLQSITDTTSLLLSMRGQLAFQNLDSSEKSSLGGPRGVRAYAVGDGVGDDLFQATLELRQRVPGWSIFGAPVLFSAFIDGGRFKGWHDPMRFDENNAITLGGYGVGLNLTRRDDIQFRLDVASKINAINLPGSDNSRTRAWATLQKWF